MKIGSRPNEIFIANFSGQFVEIFTGVMQKLEDEHGIQEIPLAIQGFVIDIDDNFIYLGNTTVGITKCIRLSSSLVIEIVEQSSEFDDVLDNFAPEGEGN